MARRQDYLAEILNMGNFTLGLRIIRKFAGDHFRGYATGPAAYPFLITEKAAIWGAELLNTKFVAPTYVEQDSGPPNHILVIKGNYKFVLVSDGLAKLSEPDKFIHQFKKAVDLLPDIPLKVKVYVAISDQESVESMIPWDRGLKNIVFNKDLENMPEDSQIHLFLHESWHVYLNAIYFQHFQQSWIEAKRASNKLCKSKSSQVHQQINDIRLLVEDVILGRSMREHAQYDVANYDGLEFLINEAQKNIHLHSESGRRELFTNMLHVLLAVITPLPIDRLTYKRMYHRQFNLLQRALDVGSEFDRTFERKFLQCRNFLNKALKRKRYLTAPEIIHLRDFMKFDVSDQASSSKLL